MAQYNIRQYHAITATKIAGRTRCKSSSYCGNIINCFTGKIQGIYLIEDYVKKTIDGKITTD
jgi:hypothetical protein